MQISAQYVVVKRLAEQKREGFSAVEPGDSFAYKGTVVELPGEPVHVSNQQLLHGSIVLFAKHSPDTFEVEDPAFGERVKFVKRTDILAVL